LVEGGLAGLPKLTFAGGLLIGDSAGFLNVAKIKGNHAAMKSGMLAAEAIAEHLNDTECTSYTDKFKSSWLYDELYKVRNIRQGFKWGRFLGLIHAGFQTIGGWRLPYTLPHHADHSSLKLASVSTPPTYAKPDGVLTFDRLSSVFISNTNHEEDQPCHLKLKDAGIPLSVNLSKWAEPAQRYCPAGVYEIVEENGEKAFRINAQNCVHCKTCDIKDPSQNINWTTPQGGGGPNYTGM
jgi:electron-transferring-flavoprotein dehydrogenase